ncbi:MAG: RNA-binding protein [Anaerolineae bacterium SM23_84]|nr:MAG: RNA-binding protein [Anaerolineae bacterium SM23_84]
MNKNLFVGNLSYDATADQLRDLFATAGTVVEAKVIYDRYTNRSRGFGFVEMATEAEAQEAIEKLNGQELVGRQISVDEARPRRRERSPSSYRYSRW